MSDISRDYLEYICSFVSDYCKQRRRSYKKFLKTLHSIPFFYIMEMDGNRAYDGEDLRYRFALDRNVPNAIVSNVLDNNPCSVLEMMVALSLRMEETIMMNGKFGNRTSEWFWDMVSSLGLLHTYDSVFDESEVYDKIDILLNRRYRPDGTGGLFVLNNGQDLRQLDIWYQMNLYLSSVISKGGE